MNEQQIQLEPGAGTGHAVPQIAHQGNPIGLAILIDDGQVDQMIYKRVARRSGLVERSLSFLNAPDALQYLRDNPDQRVDMILLDVNMPRMTGFEFLRSATEELGPDFAISCHVMLTNELSPTDRARAEAFDVVKGFINKPLTEASLGEAARRVS